MRITTKSDYALILMLELAQSNNIIALGKIAKQFRLSLSYLEQLANSLRQAKLIKSHQGINGGYALTKPAAEISIKEIISSVGDKTDSVSCLGDDYSCERQDGCIAFSSWRLINQKINNLLEETKLSDLLNK